MGRKEGATERQDEQEPTSQEIPAANRNGDLDRDDLVIS